MGMRAVRSQNSRASVPKIGSVRDPLKVWLFVVATFGVYAVVHHYVVNRELHDFGIDVDPRKSVLAFFPGIILVLPFLVTTFRTGERIAIAQETEDLPRTANGLVSSLVSVALFAGSAYHQSQLNKVWQLQRSIKGDS